MRVQVVKCASSYIEGNERKRRERKFCRRFHTWRNAFQFVSRLLLNCLETQWWRESQLGCDDDDDDALFTPQDLHHDVAPCPIGGLVPPHPAVTRTYR